MKGNGFRIYELAECMVKETDNDALDSRIFTHGLGAERKVIV